MSEDYQLEQILDLAKKQGAKQAEIYRITSSSQPVILEGNRLKQIETSESWGLALRLWKDSKPGLAVGYGEIDTATLVEKAIAVSELNPPETPEIATSRQAIYATVGQQLATEKLIDWGKQAIVQLREAYPEGITSGELESELVTTTLLNTEGLYCSYSRYENSCSLGVEWVRGEDFLGIYDGQSSDHMLQPEEVVKKILQRLGWAKNTAVADKGQQPVLFTADAGALLWSIVASALNGKRVLEKSSPWSEETGNQVLSEMLSVSQNPDLEGVNCPFDDEGTPTQKLQLVEQGKLCQFYSDRTTGKALGSQTTGNGFRPSLSRYPTPELVNLSVTGTDNSFNDLVSQLQNGIIVDQILGGGPDISGDFSVNLDLGYRVKNGEIIGRVKDTMVAGNVYTALKQVVALGSDADPQDFYHTPSIIVAGLSVVN